MNPILIKIFATALTLSQITTRPDDVKIAFDPQRDRQEVVMLLQAGCQQMIKTFGVEDINFDELIDTAMADPQAIAGDMKGFNGLNFNDLLVAYKEFCKKENVENSPIKLDEVMAYYNKAVADLPDPAKLKGAKLPGSSFILDGKGERFTEVYEQDNRRIWAALDAIPDHVAQAFIAAEDKRFFEHKGIDERSIIRAFMSNFGQAGRPQGGSTISQQVSKNLLVGDDLTYERKMKEMISASRLEKLLTKNEILELYLNHVFLGRASWGVEMAARSYFKKSVKDLTIAEAAFMAALAKGPNYYNPDLHIQRVRDRINYVLNRMREDGFITPDQMKEAQAQTLPFIAFESPRTRGGFYFLDAVISDSKKQGGVPGLTKASYVVKSTIHPGLQRAAEEAIQEGLARYELNSGRFQFTAPERNLTEAIEKLRQAAAVEGAAPQDPASARPLWRQALEAARMPLYDVHWTPAIVVSKTREKGKKTDTVTVGLKDGRTAPLKAWTDAIRAKLQVNDVVYVRLVETKGVLSADLRMRPSVQGAALVLENKTGKILAMAGGFSYPLSQLNRATQMERQPGSVLKPLTYLAALSKQGLQPNTLIWDTPITLPPVQRGPKAEYWTPKNYDGQAGGLMTLRSALEASKNYVTARLLDGAIDETPERSLNFLCDAAKELSLYESCVRHYPFILGAQPARMVNLAAFYATIANEGLRPTPHVIEYIEQDGRRIYEEKGDILLPVSSFDGVAFYQMKTFLQGVLQRGTARSIKDLSGYVGGKTGTTDRENDAWFVGFTNDLTVAVWVGYDNADKRRTLGRDFTGGKVAVPIFQSIIDKSWTSYAPKTALAPPSARTRTLLTTLPIDIRTGDLVSDDRSCDQFGSAFPSNGFDSPFRTSDRGCNRPLANVFNEHFRLSARTGRMDDTQSRLASRGEPEEYASRSVDEDDEWGSPQEPALRRPGESDATSDRLFGRQERYAEPPMTDTFDRQARRPRRIDPDLFWRRFF